MPQLLLVVALFFTVASPLWAEPAGQITGAVGTQPAPLTPTEAAEVEKALARLQQVVATNPGDRESRLKIADLHMHLGRASEAAAVYRSVVIEEPSNIRALAGAGKALLAARQFEAAITSLTAAEKLAPGDPTILSALGRAYAETGRARESLPYLERAAGERPNATQWMALQRAHQAFDHRVTVQGLGESFDAGVADTRGTDVALHIRMSERTRVTGRVQWQRKFGWRDERAGGGIEWRANNTTTLRAAALLGGSSNRVLPQHEFVFGVDRAHGVVDWGVTMRVFDFFDARTSAVGPSISWWAAERLRLGLDYALVASAFGGDTSELRHAATARGEYQWLPRVAMIGAFSYGIENFDALSIDRVGPMRSNTLSAGTRVDLRRAMAVQLSWDRQWRDQLADMHRFTIGLTQRF